MTLDRYLTENSIQPDAFASDLGVTVNAVKFWASGARIPRKDQMEKIFKLTSGAVTPNDFFEIEITEAAQ